MAKTLPPKLDGPRAPNTPTQRLPEVKGEPLSDSRAVTQKDLRTSTQKDLRADEEDDAPDRAPTGPPMPARGRTIAIPAHRAAAEAAAGEAKRKAGKLGASSSASTQKMAVVSPPLPDAEQPGSLYEILQNAEEPGVLFHEDDPDQQGQQGERDEAAPDPALLEAVEEAIRLLFGVKGIHHIGPGTNAEGEPVIVIAAEQGFTEAALKQIPPAVRNFKTLLAVPFDLLPLRRVRP